ncbi:hypothetical protein [Agrobacterium cavarae]|uniref:hypothetical protein n=1 Tax=Agrobacterium cavarae TaxID=2528239 RepID=UPI003EE6FE26
MKRLDEGDAFEETAGGGCGRGDDKLAEKIAAIKEKRDRYNALLDELDDKGEGQISLTNPDARTMARMTKVEVGYKYLARSRCEAQADRLAGRLQPGARHGTSYADGRGGDRNALRRQD